jgi:mono/diheme cytochrome c family protein
MTFDLFGSSALSIASMGVAYLASCAAASSMAPDWGRARTTSPQGAAVYERECASCHGKLGDGSRGIPSVAGPGALPVERGGRAPLRTALDVYDYVSKTMPLPPKYAGTLRPDEYWSVVDFILRAHGAEVPEERLNARNAPDVLVN